MNYNICESFFNFNEISLIHNKLFLLYYFFQGQPEREPCSICKNLCHTGLFVDVAIGNRSLLYTMTILALWCHADYSPEQNKKIIKKCVCDECCQNSSYKNFKKVMYSMKFFREKNPWWLKTNRDIKKIPKKIIFKSIILQHSKRIISKLFCCCTNEEKNQNIHYLNFLSITISNTKKNIFKTS